MNQQENTYRLLCMFDQLLTALRRVRTLLLSVPALQFGGEMRLVVHVVSYKEVAVKYRREKKQELHLKPGSTERRSITPDGYTSHAHQYRFFTRLAGRNGLLCTFPPDDAFRATTPHFA